MVYISQSTLTNLGLLYFFVNYIVREFTTEDEEEEEEKEKGGGGEKETNRNNIKRRRTIKNK